MAWRTSTAIANKPLQGDVCLQEHGRKVEFHNIRIKEIKDPVK